MVHAASAVAFAVLALNAASTLAMPIESYHLMERDFETVDLEDREFDLEFDAREFDELDIVEREFHQELVEHTPTITSSTVSKVSSTTSASKTSSATKSTITPEPKQANKNAKASKTITIIHEVKATGCVKATSKSPKAKKPVISNKRISDLLAKLRKAKAAQLAKMKIAEAKTTKLKKNSKATKAKSSKTKSAPSTSVSSTKIASTTSATASTTSTTASTASTTSATASTALSTASTKHSLPTPSTKSTASRAKITPAPKSGNKIPKGVKVKDTKKVGTNGITTIHRTITAAPTACAESPKESTSTKTNTKFHDFGGFADVVERLYEVDEVD